MYHGSKSKSHQWGSWSDWVLDEQHRRYYRFRQDSEGNYDYDWDQRDSAAAAHAQTPRDTTINDITEGLKGLTTDYDGSISEEHMPSSRSGRPKKPRPRILCMLPRRGSMSTWRVNTSTDHPKRSITSGRLQNPSRVLRMAKMIGQLTDQYADDELADTIAASQQYNYNAYANPGESSASAYAQYDEDEDEGPPTPKAQSGAGSYHITALEEPLEELDPRYKVEPSSKFQPGEIFKVHWSEPQGASSESAPSVSGKHEIQNRFGTKFFVGFRRFIVIANDQGHCTCVPILTYGGKGCKKKGVKADKHGIIYERGSKPRLLDKEPKLGFPPVRVEMKEEGEKLSKESRVNYSKLVTVEHNVKVFFIGSIVYNDWDLVSDAVNHCWNKKNHQKQRHR
ncbi:hypothetical protein TgHK011_000289 [Trichoderma gracile]|nr:hypothetical protein TgHK011_000289 [Trichoderma gracile]